MNDESIKINTDIDNSIYSLLYNYNEKYNYTHTSHNLSESNDYIRSHKNYSERNDYTNVNGSILLWEECNSIDDIPLILTTHTDSDLDIFNELETRLDYVF